MIWARVCVAPTGEVCGEGPIWRAARDADYWTDINRLLIRRPDQPGSAVRTLSTLLAWPHQD